MLVIGVALGSVAFPSTKTETTSQLFSVTTTVTRNLISQTTTTTTAVQKQTLMSVSTVQYYIYSNSFGNFSSSNYRVVTKIILLQPYQEVLFPPCLTATLQTSTSTIYVFAPQQLAENYSTTVTLVISIATTSYTSTTLFTLSSGETCG